MKIVPATIVISVIHPCFPFSKNALQFSIDELKLISQDKSSISLYFQIQILYYSIHIILKLNYQERGLVGHEIRYMCYLQFKEYWWTWKYFMFNKKVFTLVHASINFRFNKGKLYPSSLNDFLAFAFGWCNKRWLKSFYGETLKKNFLFLRRQKPREIWTKALTTFSAHKTTDWSTRPTHYFFTCCPSVRPSVHTSVPTFQNLAKTKPSSRLNSDRYWRNWGSGRVDHWWHPCLVYIFL